MLGDRFRVVREFSSVLMVAVGVTLVGTLIGAVADHVHQVDAEAMPVAETKAVPGVGSQVLAIHEWGVQLVLPLAEELPLVSYVSQSSESVGLSSADLSALGADCRASRNGLGTLLRLPQGSYAAYASRDASAHFVGALGQYDYAYQTPHNACANKPGAPELLNREMTVLSETWKSLAPIAK